MKVYKNKTNCNCANCGKNDSVYTIDNGTKFKLSFCGECAKDLIVQFVNVLEKGDNYTYIKIPDWCEIDSFIEWHCPIITGQDWVRERIVGFGYNGFFHQATNSPVYFSEFSEFGKTVRLETE